jgi:hypothetical protein
VEIWTLIVLSEPENDAESTALLVSHGPTGPEDEAARRATAITDFCWDLIGKLPEAEKTARTGSVDSLKVTPPCGG